MVMVMVMLMVMVMVTLASNMRIINSVEGKYATKTFPTFSLFLDSCGKAFYAGTLSIYCLAKKGVGR